MISSLICRLFLVFVLCSLLVSFPVPLMAQNQDETPAQMQEASSPADPNLQSALEHLTRAILFKQRNDIDSAVAEYFKALEIDSNVTQYNDEGIVAEIVRRYKKTLDRLPADAVSVQPVNTQTQALTIRINELEQKIESLEKEKSEAANEWEEREKELEGKITDLTDQLENSEHMRSVYKGRWLRNKDN
jgi:archaellum component FlaC